MTERTDRRAHGRRGPASGEWKRVSRGHGEGGARCYIETETWREALLLARIDPDTPLESLRVRFSPLHKADGRQARIMVAVRFEEGSEEQCEID